MAKKDVNDYGLNAKQSAFCEYYVVNGSAGLSYQKAYDPEGEKGLKIGSCYTNGSRLMKNEKVKNYLNHLKGQVKTEKLLSVQDILGELTEIAQDFGTKTSDKIRSLELLGKFHSMWSDNLNVSNDTVVEINLSAELEQDTGEIVEQNVEKIEKKKAGNE